MSEVLRSVGLDIGTTSTQMILSELTVENRAGSFSVPDMAITDRKILYRSPVHFTPLMDESHMDADALRLLIQEEYRKAGITRETVDTGAVIITGETSRRENAQSVLTALSELAGDFVVTAAGPDLESVLAAKGAGAITLSQTTHRPVLHMDIGGGTSNLALIWEGKILRTGCLNVGGRLLKIREDGTIIYVSPVLSGLCNLKPGDRPELSHLQTLAGELCHALEMAAGLREPSPLLDSLMTREAATFWLPSKERPILSFSGGVADCIRQEHAPFAFGDIGPVLGQAIRRSRLCQEDYVLGRETIRATVIGAGCHSTQLSGSTVFYQNIQFPLKNLPVEHINRPRVHQEHDAVIYSLEGFSAPGFSQIAALADRLVQEISPPYYFCLRQDMAKALGQALAVRLPPQTPVLCIDRVIIQENSYLDIAAPVAQALPVVVKTLVFHNDAIAKPSD